MIQLSWSCETLAMAGAGTLTASKVAPVGAHRSPHSFGALLVGVGDGVAHRRVGLQVPHVVVVHDAEPARRGTRRRWPAAPRPRPAPPWPGSPRTSARISCSRATAAARRFSASAWATRRSAAAWSACSLAPMFSPDVDVGDVDRDDLERRLRVERVVQHRLRDHARVGQHVLVVVGRADGLDDALADAGDDRLLGRPADEPFELRPHRHAGLGPQLNAVAADGVERTAGPWPGRGSR